MIVLKSKYFWTLIAGLIVFLVHAFFPNFFPELITVENIVLVVGFILGLFGIEFVEAFAKARGLR